MSTLIDKLNHLKTSIDRIFDALYEIGIYTSKDTKLSDVSRLISNIKVQGILQITDGVKFSGSNFAELPEKMQIASGTHNVDQIFKNCKGTKAPDISNYVNIQSANEAFCGCKDLLQLNIFPSLTHMDRIFDGCTALQRINYLDLSNVVSMTNAFRGCDNLAYLKIHNLGKSKDLIDYDFSSLVSWGDANMVTDARTSLNDSFVNDIFDRKSAGYPNATLHISSMVIVRLSEPIKKSLAAKGYIISEQ